MKRTLLYLLLVALSSIAVAMDGSSRVEKPIVVLRETARSGHELIIETREIRPKPLTTEQQNSTTLIKPTRAIRCQASVITSGEDCQRVLWQQDFTNRGKNISVLHIFKLLDARLLDEQTLVVVYLAALGVHADIIVADVAGGSVIASQRLPGDDNEGPPTLLVHGAEVEFDGLTNVKILGDSLDNVSINLSGQNNLANPPRETSADFDLRADGEAYRWMRRDERQEQGHLDFSAGAMIPRSAPSKARRKLSVPEQKTGSP